MWAICADRTRQWFVFKMYNYIAPAKIAWMIQSFGLTLDNAVISWDVNGYSLIMKRNDWEEMKERWCKVESQELTMTAVGMCAWFGVEQIGDTYNCRVLVVIKDSSVRGRRYRRSRMCFCTQSASYKFLSYVALRTPVPVVGSSRNIILVLAYLTQVGTWTRDEGRGTRSWEASITSKHMPVSTCHYR